MDAVRYANDMEPAAITFRGVTYRRYPDSSNHAHRVYYTPGIKAKQDGADYLHRDIWKVHNGPIPDGFQIHHIDHNPFNNDISNLACMSQKDHLDLHVPEWNKARVTEDWLQHLETIRPLAAAWHGSPEGIEWHREHGVKVMAKRPVLAGTCDQCGNAFLSKKPVRFCSNKCRAASRRASGVDNVTRTCDYCGETFTVDRYAKTSTCSRTCAQRKRRAVG